MNRIATALALASFLFGSACKGDGKSKATETSPESTSPAAGAPTGQGQSAGAAAVESGGSGQAGESGDTGTGEAATPPDGAGGIAFYFDRALTDADLAGKSLRELSLMRNTIFARAGNQFHKKWLHDYFAAQSWYQPLDKLDESRLSKIDWANANTIGKREASIESAELIRMKDELIAAIADGEPSTEQAIELRLISQRLGKWIGPESASDSERTPLEDPELLDKLIAADQLSNLSRRDLRILRNTIYARRGYVFKSDLLGEYFHGIEWYEPDDDYSDDRLSSIDRKNIKMIKSVEDQHGGPLTDRDHMELDGWFSGA